METQADRVPTEPAAPAMPPALVHAALEACPIGVALIDAAGPAPFALYANPVFRRMSGGAQSGPLSDVFGNAFAATAESAMRSAMVNRGAERITLRDPVHGGSFDLAISAPQDGQSTLLCYLSDVSALARHQQTIRFLATHDEVTGLPNRHALDEKLQGALAQASKEGGALALLSLSIDQLDAINGQLGHDGGDAYLAALAMRLTACVGARDAVLRQGGSEFALLVGQINNPYQVHQLCSNVLDALAEPLDVAGMPKRPACNIGVALYPDDAVDAATLLRYSRLALVKARQQGHHTFELFSLELDLRMDARAELAVALREAIAQDQLELLYQPLADLRDGSIAAIEALVRWDHPLFGETSGPHFDALAEDAGLAGDVCAWAMARATQDLAGWNESGINPPRVALNAALAQVLDPQFAEQVAQALSATGVAPQQLCVEVTEAILVADPEAAGHTLGILKALGVCLTLDHFGTHDSSLSHLKSLPLDLVKIDNALIANIENAPEDAAMVTSLIAMSHNLGIAVAAHGVENEAQCDFLRRNMCDQIQGSIFSPPLSAADLAGLLGRGHALPAHLLRIQRQKRTLLLVDDEPNIVSSLKRLMRRDGYQILTANSGAEGLEVLAANAVDVIVSDQRMPGMIGADFLRAAKELYPDTIRIMLSGYTELQSVTDAVNEGAIYKFLTKPWDDEQLRGHITEAFRLKEIADENERLNLELRTANYDMALANRKMEELLRQKQQQISRGEVSLNVAREVLQNLPLPVIGLDDAGMVAFLNGAATALFRGGGALLGNEAPVVMPELFPDGWDSSLSHEALIEGRRYHVLSHPMGEQSQSRGSLITLSRCEE